MKEYTIQRVRTKNAQADLPSSARIRVNNAGIIKAVCDQTERFFGYPAHELLDEPFNKLVPANVYDPSAPHFREKLAAGEVIETTFQHKSGYFFIARMRIAPKDEQVLPKQPEYQVRKLSESGDKQLFDDSQLLARMGIWEFDTTNRQFDWSEGVYRLFELDPGLPLSTEHMLYYFNEDQKRVKNAFRRCLRNGEHWSLDLQIVTARNHIRPVRIAGKGHTHKGRVIRVTGIVQDMSELHLARREKNFLTNCVEGILQSTDDLILTLDKELNVILVNEPLKKEYYKTFGEHIEVGQSIMATLKNHPNERRIYHRLWERALTRDSFVVEMPLAQRDEDLPIYEMHFHRIESNDGELLGACSIAKNISSRIRVQEKINYMARHDPLTGLYNRREFQNLLGRTVGNAKKRSARHALLYMDLEQFYAVNDKGGQTAGDSLLREVGQILSSKVRQRDAIARIGGDEFAALLENCTDQEAERVAETIRDAIREYRFEYQGHTFQVGISIGIVPIDEHSDSPAKLMKLADSVCYAAKTAGANRIHVYRSRTHADQETENAVAIIDLIKRALEFNDYFKFYVQTIKPITSAVWGDFFEVFVRIFDEKGNLVLPDEFLPTAETYDLTRDIDLTVTEHIFRWLTTRFHAMHRLKKIFINISEASARHPGFADELIERIRKHKIDPGKLCFEVHEHFFIHSPEIAQRFIQRLREAGCSLAVDNAGSEASNYEYLTQVDVDFVKISGAVMNQLTTDPVKLVIVDAIHRIATISGKQTVGHHIADEHVLSEARKLGLHFGQGIKLGDLMKLTEYDELHHRLHHNTASGQDTSQENPV